MSCVRCFSAWKKCYFIAYKGCWISHAETNHQWYQANIIINRHIIICRRYSSFWSRPFDAISVNIHCRDTIEDNTVIKAIRLFSNIACSDRIMQKFCGIFSKVARRARIMLRDASGHWGPRIWQGTVEMNSLQCLRGQLQLVAHNSWRQYIHVAVQEEVVDVDESNSFLSRMIECWMA